MFAIDHVVLLAGAFLLLGIASSKLSARLGVPVLVLFLVLGMIAGSDGLGQIPFEDYRLAHAVGTVALALILFDGGLSTSVSAIRLAWKPSLTMATVGVFLTAGLTGLTASWVLGIGWLEGLLLGSIVGSTDAAAVFSVLRSSGVNLPPRLASVLEVESASNDPMAIFLTIGCIELLLGQQTFGWGLLALLASQMVVGGIAGLLGGFIGGWVINRIHLAAAGMYPVLASAFCFLTYGLAVQFGGSGFLAVYLAGLVLGNQTLVFQRGIRMFHDAFAWLAQIVMFVILGLLCFPHRLLDVAGQALLISLVLIFLARPVAVLVSALPFRFSWRELTFMSWVGLKGAVPITLATFPLMLAQPGNSLQASLIFDVVFFIVVLSAIIQGVGLAPIARALKLETPRVPEPPFSLEISSLRHVEGEIVDYPVGPNAFATGRMVRHLGLPAGAVIALIARGRDVIPPQGSTRIEPGDHVILALRPGMRPLLDRIFGPKDDACLPPEPSLRFPFRPTTTVGELQDLYGLTTRLPADRTLTDALRAELDGKPLAVGDTARFGRLSFQIHSLTAEKTVDTIVMTILPEEPPTDKPEASPVPSQTPPASPTPPE